MGSGCLYGNKPVNKDVELNKNKENKEDVDSKTDNNINKPLNTEEKKLKKNDKKSKMSQIIDYFNEEESAMLEEYTKQKEKTKGMGKKNNNEKYELMLKRLLEQQNIKKIGPKRRQTIRTDGEKIKNIVTELLQENKNNVLKPKPIENGTLIIKQYPKKQGILSMTVDKNSLLNYNKKVGNNFFKKRNSLNEFLAKDKFTDYSQLQSKKSSKD